MAKRKPIVSRTFAPIHFEDLDPHRFEDLVRELIYDFRDWRNIEATGRSGDDAGFDIRAFEKLPPLAAEDDEEDTVDTRHPMDGPRWMIQGKREKTLTPSDVKEILADVDANDPPYGYILAASAIFSKKSYDLFRDELRKKSVMEFYLWGRGELEDMLHLPKNDRILFTFFGISLVSRRRSRTTEIRAAITIKNKLYKLLGDPDSMLDKLVLIRDVNDVHYPFRDEYLDFTKRPRWIERSVVRHHPNGLIVHNQEFYAFVDKAKRQWDYTEHFNSLVFRRTVLSDEEREEFGNRNQEVRSIWEFLPRSQQAKFEIMGFLPYSDIMFVDPDGDAHYHFPHLYAEFTSASGPYSQFSDKLTVGGERIELDDSWRRIDFFPKTFASSAPKRRIHDTPKIKLDAETLKSVMRYESSLKELYAVDDRYDFLHPHDVVFLENTADSPQEPGRALEVRYVHKGTLIEYLSQHPESYRIRQTARSQVGRDIVDDEPITILEVDPTWVYERN